MQINIKFWLIFNLAIGLSMLAASFVGQTNGPVDQVLNETQIATEIETVSEKSENQEAPEQSNTKQVVEKYFQDIPVLIDIASCESHFRQFDENGSVLRGKQNSLDVGVMQINEKYHLKESVELGMNIHTLEGNLAYAKHLYEQQGTKPWKYSSACWNKNREVALAN